MFIVKRLLLCIPILFGITFFSFALMRVAGSDAVIQKYDNIGIVASQKVIDAERSRLHLDKSFLIQYGSWLKSLASGNMGVSFISGKNIFDLFTSKLPATLLLTVAAIFLTIIVSIPLGILAAINHNKVSDYIIRFVSFVGNSMPNFFVGLVLMYFFALKFGLFPVITTGINLKSVFLPALTLAIAMSAKYMRQVRATVLDELSKNYVMGEKARGIPFSKTLCKSVLRSCLITIITLLALSIGSLLGGTAIVESIFMWDGVGKLAVDSINMRDYPMIQAYVVWMSIIYVCINLIADISYSLLDPRIRLRNDAA